MNDKDKDLRAAAEALLAQAHAVRQGRLMRLRDAGSASFLASFLKRRWILFSALTLILTAVLAPVRTYVFRRPLLLALVYGAGIVLVGGGVLALLAGLLRWFHLRWLFTSLPPAGDTSATERVR